MHNGQKTPFARSLHEFGDIKVQDWLSQLPWSAPATVTKVVGALVQVKLAINAPPFALPVLLVPQSSSNWAREPTQVGDLGRIVGTGYYLGGQSGLGGGTADLYPRANLTGAVWEPVSQQGFSTVDANAYVLQGPNGVVLMDSGKMTVVTITPTGVSIVDANGNEIVTSSGKVFVKPGSGDVYLGGDGVTGSYALVTTASGPSMNVKARYA
jgi:hypothetical protein